MDAYTWKNFIRNHKKSVPIHWTHFPCYLVAHAVPLPKFQHTRDIAESKLSVFLHDAPFYARNNPCMHL